MAKERFALDYIDVATRIVEFRAKHPDGSLQQVTLDFREINGGWWCIFTAAAYRTPDDIRPGIGTAWEPIPGRTNFTRDSEVQNAETAAWGRAIVAAMAADTKRGIASAEEVRNSREREESRTSVEVARAELAALCRDRGLSLDAVAAEFAESFGVPITAATEAQVREYLATVRGGVAPDQPARPRYARPVSEVDAERNPEHPEVERAERLAEAKIRRDALGVDSSGKAAKGTPKAERTTADDIPQNDLWAVEPHG